MRAEFDIQPEAFVFEAEPEEFAAWQPEASGPWQQEQNRGSADYIRWVQSALNQVLGLNLAVDGRMGPQTRSAIRTFQQRQGLTADGIVGPRTEAALIAAGAPRPLGAAPGTSALCPPQPQFVDCPRPDLRPAEVLDRFDFDKSDLKPHHTPILIKVARQIVASRRTQQPIGSVMLAGHTDTVGDDDYNFALARRRASVVMESLCNTLERMLPGVTRGIRFQLTSCGERQPESTPEGSRRVAIYLPTKAPPPPVPPLPVPPTPPVTIPPRCLFRPSAHGFRFVNFFTLPTAITAPLSRLGIPIGSGAYGLCGGMSLLAGDHFSFSVAIPTRSTVPAIGSPLYNKLVARQLDSLNLNLSSIGSGFGAPVLKFFDWMGRADRGAGSTAALTTAELRRVTAALRRSRLVVIGLVLVSRSTGALTDNHQVLVHCMTRHSPSRADLHIYDPNHPGRDDIRIEVETVGGETLSTHVVPSGAGATRGPVHGFFVMPFTPKRP